MSADDIQTVVANLVSADVDALVLAGGNGTMAMLAAVESASQSMSANLRVVGIPKTIDNDLLNVHFSPGFASAANYVSSVVPAIAMDHMAMSAIEPIRVVETMGRSVGWLAASAAAAMHKHELPVALCLIPEMGPIDEESLFSATEAALGKHSRAFVICAEGSDYDTTASEYTRKNHSSLLFGGVARKIARRLGEEFQLPARGEVLGTQQRCAHHFATSADTEAARLVGRAAGEAINAGLSGEMVTLNRETLSRRLITSTIPLTVPAGKERPLPPAFHPQYPNGMHSYSSWLEPLLGS